MRFLQALHDSSQALNLSFKVLLSSVSVHRLQPMSTSCNEQPLSVRDHNGRSPKPVPHNCQGQNSCWLLTTVIDQWGYPMSPGVTVCFLLTGGSPWHQSGLGFGMPLVCLTAASNVKHSCNGDVDLAAKESNWLMFTHRSKLKNAWNATWSWSNLVRNDFWRQLFEKTSTFSNLFKPFNLLNLCQIVSEETALA